MCGRHDHSQPLSHCLLSLSAHVCLHKLSYYHRLECCSSGENKDDTKTYFNLHLDQHHQECSTPHWLQHVVAPVSAPGSQSSLTMCECLVQVKVCLVPSENSCHGLKISVGILFNKTVATTQLLSLFTYRL